MSKENIPDVETKTFYRAFCRCGWQDKWVESRRAALIIADDHYECKKWHPFVGQPVPQPERGIRNGSPPSLTADYDEAEECPHQVLYSEDCPRCPDWDAEAEARGQSLRCDEED